MLSDGHIDSHGRIDLYNKNEEYILYIKSVLENITNTRCHIYKKYDKRFNVFGYRLTTNSTPYFKKLRAIFYNEDGVKHITKYIADRIDFEALAHIWMCDGYMYHAINRQSNTIRNIGYFCLEGFPKEELDIFNKRLSELGIDARYDKVAWGRGYRLAISSYPLQRFIDNIIQYMLPCFMYKTILYYKSMWFVDSSLQSAEQYIRNYDSVEDIVRHS